MKRLSVAIGALLLVLVYSDWLRGAEPMALPDVPLSTVSGTVVSSSQACKTGRWLLVYLRPNGQPDKFLLDALRVKSTVPLSSIVFVAAGVSGDKLASFIDKVPELAVASWFADPDAQLGSHLKLAGSPVVLAMQNANVEWSLSGKPFDNQKINSVLSDWVASSGDGQPGTAPAASK